MYNIFVLANHVKLFEFFCYMFLYIDVLLLLMLMFMLLLLLLKIIYKKVLLLKTSINWLGKIINKLNNKEAILSFRLKIVAKWRNISNKLKTNLKTKEKVKIFKKYVHFCKFHTKLTFFGKKSFIHINIIKFIYL